MGLRGIAVFLVWTLPLACGATSYFVSPDGSDANPGSSELPFQTAAHGMSVLQAGDTLTLRAGVYQETTFLLAAGTAEAPITVTAEPGAVFESPDPSGHAEAINVGANARYVRLNGIEARAGFGEAILVRLGAENIEINNCNLHGNRVGLAVVGASYVSVNGCALYENVRAGLRITGGSHHITITDTEAYLNSDGLGCTGEGDGFVSDDGTNSHLTFVRTRSYDNSEDAYDIRGSQLVFDQVESKSFCNGFKLGSSASLSNCLVTGGRVGIETTAVAEGVNYSITNCTLSGSDSPIILGAPIAPVAGYSASLTNNIIVGPNRALDYNTAVTLVESHNLFWNGNVDSTVIRVLPNNGSFNGNSINLGAYTTATGQGVGSLAMNPLFHDAANGDYAPDLPSVAIDRADLAAAPAVDIFGQVRPLGFAPDLGAIETTHVIANHPPRAHAGTWRSRRVRYGRPSLFDAAASFDPNGDALTYLWDFGDGTTSNLRQSLHAYATLGEYTATLTVWDGSLASTDSVNVSVVGRIVRPTRTPTPTVPGPGTPTGTPSGSPLPSAVFSALFPTSIKRGAFKTISVRYRNLLGPATLTIDLPPELQFIAAAPLGFLHNGNRLLWTATAFPSGAFKVRVQARTDILPGTFALTTVVLTEGNGAETVRDAATRID